MFWKKKNKGPVIEKIVLQLIEMGQRDVPLAL